VYNGQDKRPEEYKRVWKSQDGDDKDTSPPGMEILGRNGTQRSSGEFTFKDQYGGASPGSWGAGSSPGGATPWGMQLAGAGTSLQEGAIPIAAPKDQDDMMMFNPSSLGSMGSAPTMGSMGSMGAEGLAHLGELGSIGTGSLGSLGAPIGSIGSMGNGLGSVGSLGSMFPQDAMQVDSATRTPSMSDSFVGGHSQRTPSGLSDTSMNLDDDL